MREDENFYCLYLRRLGVVLIGFALFDLLLTALVWFLFPELAGIDRRCMLVNALAALAAGLVARERSRRDARQTLALALLGVLLAVQIASLLVGSGGEPDTLVSGTLILSALCLYLMLLSQRRSHVWKQVLREKPLSLNLRIGSSGELFDSLVMAPHLEINPSIIAAVDRFLEVEGRKAPLHLTIHCASPVSEPVQELMIEGFREHYADVERQVNRFLATRFGRAIALIVVSVVALTGMKLINEDTNSGIFWTIVGNYAAFSLWQIGNTYFERAEAHHKLLRASIARSASFHFIA